MVERTQDPQRYLGFPRRITYNLDAIEKACLDALANGGRDSRAMDTFHTMASPATVHALVQVAKTTFTEQELQDLGRLIDELMNCIKQMADEQLGAKSTDREGLILRARQLRSSLGI